MTPRGAPSTAFGMPQYFDPLPKEVFLQCSARPAGEQPTSRPAASVACAVGLSTAAAARVLAACRPVLQAAQTQLRHESRDLGKTTLEYKQADEQNPTSPAPTCGWVWPAKGIGIDWFVDEYINHEMCSLLPQAGNASKPHLGLLAETGCRQSRSGHTGCLKAHLRQARPLGRQGPAARCCQSLHCSSGCPGARIKLLKLSRIWLCDRRGQMLQVRWRIDGARVAQQSERRTARGSRWQGKILPCLHFRTYH